MASSADRKAARSVGRLCQRFYHRRDIVDRLWGDETQRMKGGCLGREIRRKRGVVSSAAWKKDFVCTEQRDQGFALGFHFMQELVENL